MYIAVRGDLPAGLQAAQAVHAAIGHCLANPEATRKWHDESNYLVIVSARDEDHLVDLIDRGIRRYGLKPTVFREPDLNNEITAVVFEPGPAASRLCSSLPLALREEALV